MLDYFIRFNSEDLTSGQIAVVIKSIQDRILNELLPSLFDNPEECAKLKLKIEKYSAAAAVCVADNITRKIKGEDVSQKPASKLDQAAKFSMGLGGLAALCSAFLVSATLLNIWNPVGWIGMGVMAAGGAALMGLSAAKLKNGYLGSLAGSAFGLSVGTAGVLSVLGVVGLTNIWNPIGWALIGVGIVSVVASGITAAVKNYRASQSVERVFKSRVVSKRSSSSISVSQQSISENSPSQKLEVKSSLGRGSTHATLFDDHGMRPQTSSESVPAVPPRPQVESDQAAPSTGEVSSPVPDSESGKIIKKSL